MEDVQGFIESSKFEPDVAGPAEIERLLSGAQCVFLVLLAIARHRRAVPDRLSEEIAAAIEIKVSVREGNITLNGYAPTYAEKREHRENGGSNNWLTSKSEISTIPNQRRKEKETMEQEKKEAQVQVETLEARLKEWGIDLEKFRANADKTKGKAKTELEREVAALRAKLNEAQKKLEELKKAGDAASGELKKGIENAWAELKKAFDSATAKFE